ncbi:MAG: phosphoribosylglycinamide formyltransferase [bacterium]
MKSKETKLLRLGILGSGRGSNFIAIAEAIKRGELPATIVLVASDFADAPILAEAARRGLPTYACLPSRFRTKLEPEIETALAEQLQKAGAELVVLAGFMRVVKEPLLKKFPNRIINIHPSLLPAFSGLQAWEQALKAGVRETGCTVHRVNAVVDGGDILAQARVPILSGDTPESLHQRIQKEEHRLLPEVIRRMAEGS